MDFVPALFEWMWTISAALRISNIDVLACACTYVFAFDVIVLLMKCSHRIRTNTHTHTLYRASKRSCLLSLLGIY